MNSKLRPFTLLIVVCLLLAPRLRAQDDATNDSDLKKMLKEAEEMQKEAEDIQKKNPPAPGAKKKLAEMEAEAKAEAVRQEQEEKQEKAKLQAALKKQLETGCITRLDADDAAIHGLGYAHEKNRQRRSENYPDRHLGTYAKGTGRRLGSRRIRRRQPQSRSKQHQQQR